MAETDSIGRWLEAAGRAPLLTHREELELGRLVRAWQDWPGGANAAPAAVRRRGLRARERMASANLRLVATVARRYANATARRGLRLEDGLQEGVIGLLRAVEKFDPRSGYKFSTYGYWWIRQAIGKWLSSQSGMIRLPDGMPEQLAKLTTSEIKAMPSAQRGRYQAALMAQRICRLDAPMLSSDGETTLGELVAADEVDPLLQLDAELRVERLRALLPEDLELVETMLKHGSRGTALKRGEPVAKVKVIAARARQRLRMAA
jgi:RNA polymerase sigma factor (sigma-70 family)